MSAAPALPLAVAAALLAPGVGFSSWALWRWRRPAPGPRPLRQLAAPDFLAAALLGFGLPALLSSVLAAGRGVLADQILACCGVLAAFAYLRRRAGPGGAEPAAPGAWRWTCGCYAAALPGWIALLQFNGALVRLAGGMEPEQAVVRGLRELSLAALPPALFLAVLAQPAVEEALFRGYLLRYLAARREFGPVRGLLFSALAFAVFHEWTVALPVFYLGLLFGWVYWRTGRLEQAILVHALHNGLAILALLLPDLSFDRR